MSNVVKLPELHTGSDKEASGSSEDSVKTQQAGLLALISDVLEASSPYTSLDALAGAVQHHLGCHRVAIALTESDSLSLRALSQQAFVDTSSSESKLIQDAMQEACDRERIIRWPVIGADQRGELGILVAHRALAGRRRSISYCSVPLYHDQELVGAMLLERRDGFIFSEIQSAYLEKIAVVTAPLIALRMEADRSVFAVGRQRLNALMTSHLGTDRPGRRVLMALAALVLLCGIIIPVDSHISATAELVPLERRLITAPRAGFVQLVSVVAGEQVAQGQLLATLDARDLELEASRSASEIATAEVEFRAAMASFDRQASAVARARLAQLRAQQMLIERQLDQNSLKAPIAGLILNADTGNTQGAPVSRGDTMFEIAPADGFEVHLLVDETFVRDVFVGQTGEVMLRARPEEVLPLTVSSIHPIAESGNGSSWFRVRASLTKQFDGSSALIRPGESGQARLDGTTKNLMQIILGPVWQRIVAIKWRLVG